MKKLRFLLLCLTLSTALCFVGCADKPVPKPPVPPVVEITSVTMSKTNAVIIMGGDKLTLTATVNYSDGTTKNDVVWKSDDTSVATVADGVVTGISAGNAVITVSAKDKETVAASCAIEVIEKATITLDASTAALIMGKGNLKLNAIVRRSNGVVDNIATWSSSSPSVTVSADGILTPVSVGTAVITASATDDGKTLNETCKINVLADTSSLTNATEKGIVYTLRGAESNATLGYSVKAVVKNVTDSKLFIETTPITKVRDIAELIIPDSFKGARVTEIEEDGFRQCTKLTSFSLGKSVTKIGKNAFKLETEIELKEGEKLEMYERKEEVSSKLRANLTLNAGTTLVEGALEDSFFKVVTIPYGTTTIPAYAFNGSTVTKINFPTTLTKIEGYAFAGCKYLTSVNMLHTKLESIGAAGSDKTSVGNSFFQCGTLVKVGTLPATLKTIEPYSFSVCTNLTNITLNEGLEKIGAQAFMQCSKIPAITIPSTVIKIGGTAFGRWGADQTININLKKADQPATWSKSWQDSCKATITYKA